MALARPALFQQLEQTRQEATSRPQKYSELLRDTPLRYTAYASEITVSTKDIPWLRAKLPLWNPIGWFITLAHCASDTWLKTKEAKEEVLQKTGDRQQANAHAKYAFKRAFLFHSLATILLPFLSVVTLKHATIRLLNKLGVANAKYWGVAAGLSTIIVAPILEDPLVKRLLRRVDERWKADLVKSSPSVQ